MENKRYSILLIAFDCHYSHVARFVKYLKRINPLVGITLFADHEDISNEIKENVCDIIYRRYYKPRISKKFKRFSRFMNKILMYNQFKDLAQNRHFDIVNIHFCQYYMVYYMNLIRKMCNKIVITPWGSDVLRVGSKIKLNMLGRVYRKADMITIGPRGSVGKFICQRFGVDENKMTSLSWGSETIDYINEHIDIVSKDEAKSQLGLSGHYLITCGYNAFPEQRHEIVIDAINKVKDSLPANTILVFPVTYGGNQNKKNAYVQSLKDKVKALNLSAVFYEDYLTVKEVFLLRRSSDMFVHVQTTDAGNSTVMEYVICGNKVLHGSWMHYKWLDYEPKFYFPVDDLENLFSVIVDAYRSDLPSVPEEVVSIIKARGWSEKMIMWDEAFVSLL